MRERTKTPVRQADCRAPTRVRPHASASPAGADQCDGRVLRNPSPSKVDGKSLCWTRRARTTDVNEAVFQEQVETGEFGKE
jgi:hypothetical protein